MFCIIDYWLLQKKVLYYTGQNCQVLKFSNSKMHHFKFIRCRYAKSMLAIIPEALLSQKFYHFFPSFCFAFSALYNKISGMLLSLEL